MKIIHSTQHKELAGSVNDAPYIVTFDADGFADVEDAVADQLTSNANFGVSLVDDDGAFLTAEQKAEQEAAAIAEAEKARLAEEAKAAKAKRASEKEKGSEA